MGLSPLELLVIFVEKTLLLNKVLSIAINAKTMTYARNAYILELLVLVAQVEEVFN